MVRPAYAPALVVFFGGPSAGVSISVGVGPVVGWVSLGWGEPCVPWWGPSSFRYRPWWGGWGGPRVVNNVVINRTTVVNVQEINVYRNVSARNSVVVIKEDHFGRGPITTARVTQVDAGKLKPIHTEPRVTATPASFAPREKRGISPPREVLDRSVVVTRLPQSRADSASGKEREAESIRVPTRAPRIVSAPQQREIAPVQQRPPYGQSKVEPSLLRPLRLKVRRFVNRYRKVLLRRPLRQSSNVALRSLLPHRQSPSRLRFVRLRRRLHRHKSCRVSLPIVSRPIGPRRSSALRNPRSLNKRRRAACHRTCYEGDRATRPGLSSQFRVHLSSFRFMCPYP